MRLSRLITLLVGLSVILGLGIWLVIVLHRLYWQASYTSPFLAFLLLILLVVLLSLFVGIFVYYFYLASSSRKRKNRRLKRVAARLPEQKTEAAEENLRAIQSQLIGQVQDEVVRQELLSRSREIEASLARGELQVVVFGTGSAGKTSLVNSLIGRVVGEVGAPMGTTRIGETYCLKFRGLSRDILITDTPGILEAGVAGTEREQVARRLATEADLLLFVVDNDLRQSEYQPLKTLAEIGKRSLLVFNKMDLYSDEEQEVILARLRERVRGFIAATDVVAVAACPQTAVLDTGEVVEPEPEVMPLIKRLAAVLRAEGEDLVADNILLRSQRLGEEARKLIDQQRRRKADKVIERFQWIGAGVIAVTPLPVLDMLATAAVNAQMVVEIGRIYGCELNMERGQELALSLGKTLLSLGVVEGAKQVLVRALQLNVATYAIGKAIQAVTAAYLTRIAGKSFIEYFRHDQDWGDGGITEVVQRQFQLSRKEEFVQSFVKDAIARVVKPLTSSLALEEIDREEEDDWQERTPPSQEW